MKIRLTTMLAMLMLSIIKIRAADPTQRPEFKLSRQDEDWSVLRDPDLRTDLFDGTKFVPLNSDGSSWLTLGGEARERYEYFQNANWGRGPQDDDGYLLHRMSKLPGGPTNCGANAVASTAQTWRTGFKRSAT